ncbi:MAG: UDP-N-acetylmuramate dehydrogenase [Mobiluncus porci]|uniref:UDP-N-acetylmuramate dehydrogenase n=1 Tax=Mobiluncus TaxID=2050 RepID=UPI0023F06820|nr:MULTISPECIES: UDP-N-acetylmuramate dehydrogenase [Mobiluncus]MCI6584140.1 UDP-N-acetylmuramate dehydrogenase [Mobiluncus sp.]MDD7540590.1 UDP-N-acetylmuramate dehydrogenase [Mobiluncus porci]MDY5748715.1 UDP-N-acetylmuramate dehydrogenase [Mobiluncus porci]
MDLASSAKNLSELCTFRVGGAIKRFYQSTDTADLTAAVALADRSKVPLLFLGGGSNTLPRDEGFDGMVIKDARNSVVVVTDPEDLTISWRDSCHPDNLPNPNSFGANSAIVRADAGVMWDDLVKYAVSQGFSGIEALSGIPGTVGAAPVQNIGAYGAEIGDVIIGLTAWDRVRSKICYLVRRDMAFGYRDSILKRSRVALGGATGRWIVLGVDLELQRSTESSPVAYSQLAAALGVELGERAPLEAVRAAVLELRRGKGMVLDAADHDTWSAGSFFTNPIVPADSPILRGLPAEAPRWEVARPRSYEEIMAAMMPSVWRKNSGISGENGSAGGSVGETGSAGLERETGLKSRSSAGMASAAEPHCSEDDGRLTATDDCPTEIVGSAKGAVDAGSAKDVAVKLSAAWLIEHSGVPKGFALPESGAGVSTKHVLALTNRGGASAAEIRALADYVVSRVRETFEVELVPEPVIL